MSKSMVQRRWQRCGIGLLALAAALAVGAEAGAEMRRVEAIGATPVDARARSGGGPRDAAIEAARREAVFRVAEGLVGTSSPADPELTLERALGAEMVRYTGSFRIVEDRGERPALFVEDSDVTSEYVVVVEVVVDVLRIRSRLEEVGWLQPQAVAVGRRVRVEVEGLQDYAAYEALRKALVEGAGARSVIPAEFTPGHAVLLVESEDRAEDLLDRLQAQTPPELAVRVLGTRSDALRLQVDWTGAPAPADGAPAGR